MQIIIERQKMSNSSSGANNNKGILYQHLAGIYCLLQCYFDKTFVEIQLEPPKGEDFHLHFNNKVDYCQAKSRKSINNTEFSIIVENFTKQPILEGMDVCYTLYSENPFNTEKGDKICRIFRVINNSSIEIDCLNEYKSLIKDHLKKDYQYDFIKKIRLEIKSGEDIKNSIGRKLIKYTGARFNDEEIEKEIYSLLGEFLTISAVSGKYTSVNLKKKIGKLRKYYKEITLSGKGMKMKYSNINMAKDKYNQIIQTLADVNNELEKINSSIKGGEHE